MGRTRESVVGETEHGRGAKEEEDEEVSIRHSVQEGVGNLNESELRGRGGKQPGWWTGEWGGSEGRTGNKEQC